MEMVTVYCSGSVPKAGLAEGRLLWTDHEREELAHAAAPLKVTFLDPLDPLSDMNDSLGVFGRDMYQIRLADCVVIDARERRGIGVGVEAAVSRIWGTPLVAVVPHGTHYRMTDLAVRGSVVRDYIHPHLGSLCDAIVDSFNEAGTWIASNLTGSRRDTQRDALEAAIRAYEDRLMPLDQPMLQILKLVRERDRADSDDVQRTITRAIARPLNQNGPHD